MKRIYDLETLVVGVRYFVKCGIWQGKVIFCGTFVRSGHTYYEFTFGDSVEAAAYNFNIVAPKSKLKVWCLFSSTPEEPVTSPEAAPLEPIADLSDPVDTPEPVAADPEPEVYEYHVVEIHETPECFEYSDLGAYDSLHEAHVEACRLNYEEAVKYGTGSSYAYFVYDNVELECLRATEM